MTPHRRLLMMRAWRFATTASICFSRDHPENDSYHGSDQVRGHFQAVFHCRSEREVDEAYQSGSKPRVTKTGRWGGNHEVSSRRKEYSGKVHIVLSRCGMSSINNRLCDINREGIQNNAIVNRFLKQDGMRWTTNISSVATVRRG